MATWCHLKGINLSRNNFNEFPDVLYDIKSLNLLDLSHNNIKGKLIYFFEGILEINIEKILKELPSLKQLNLSYNACAPGLKPKLKNLCTDCIIKIE